MVFNVLYGFSIMIDYERLKFISDELKKSYIPTDEIKNEFFRRYLPTVEDIESYKVVLPESYISNDTKMKEIMDLDWLFFSEYCDAPTVFKDKGLYNDR